MMNSFVPVLVLNFGGLGLEDKISKNASLGLGNEKNCDIVRGFGRIDFDYCLDIYYLP